MQALHRFRLDTADADDYRLSEVLLDRGGKFDLNSNYAVLGRFILVTERVLDKDEKPWHIMKQLGQDSIRQMELMRFYLQWKKDPHGPNLALFVGNLPTGLSQRNYENLLTEFLGIGNFIDSIFIRLHIYCYFRKQIFFYWSNLLRIWIDGYHVRRL